MNTFSERLRAALSLRDMRPSELSQLTGIGKSDISNYVNGKYKAKQDKLYDIAIALEVSPEWLMGLDVPMLGSNGDSYPPPGFEPINYQKIPLIGEIACGTPITAEENVEDYIAVPAGVRADFCLRCKGDSMKPTCLDGDLVLIRRQPDVEDGQIAAVIIDGEATLKHVYHLPRRSGLQLVADNPAFPPILCGPDASVSVQIVGRAVAYQRLLL